MSEMRFRMANRSRDWVSSSEVGCANVVARQWTLSRRRTGLCIGKSAGAMLRVGRVEVLGPVQHVAGARQEE